MRTVPSSAVRELTRPMVYFLPILIFELAYASISLFLLSEQTDTLFVWTIKLPLTAAFLGTAYIAGLVQVLLAWHERVWVRIRLLMAPLFVDALGLLILTLLHLDQFHLGKRFGFWTQLITWDWLIAYFLLPLVVPVLFFLQTRARGVDPPRLARIPVWVRVIFGIQGTMMVLIGLLLSVAPQLADQFWLWKLTPLTAGAIGVWLAALGAGALLVIWENDWLRVRIGMISWTILGALQFLVIARYSASIYWSRPSAFLYLIFFASVFTIGLYSWLVIRQISKHPAAGLREGVTSPQTDDRG